MKFLITGGSGFIGSALIREIIYSHDHTVINIDKLTYASNKLEFKNAEKDKRYFFEKVDICNILKIRNIFKKYEPDLVMHLAAETHVDRSINNSYEFIRSNILGTYNLLEESRKYWEKIQNHHKFFKFHHISTDEVFGDLKTENYLFNEDSPYQPSSPYSASKASADHLVRSWTRTYKLPTLITNCSNNYGPYQNKEKLIPLCISNALSGKKIPIYGDGSQVRDWLYVEDHAKALLKIVLSNKLNETFNIGGNNQITNLEVVETICKILDELKPSKFPNINNYFQLVKFVKDRPGHDSRYGINTKKINKDLNWYPKESFSSGIRKTVKWYLENHEFS